MAPDTNSKYILYRTFDIIIIVIIIIKHVRTFVRIAGGIIHNFSLQLPVQLFLSVVVSSSFADTVLFIVNFRFLVLTVYIFCCFLLFLLLLTV